MDIQDRVPIYNICYRDIVCLSQYATRNNIFNSYYILDKNVGSRPSNNKPMKDCTYITILYLAASGFLSTNDSHVSFAINTNIDMCYSMVK